MLIMYAIAINEQDEIYAENLLDRSNCVPLNRSLYRLWTRMTLMTSAKTKMSYVPYERRTFYRTLIHSFNIPKNSCLYYNATNPLKINESINQAHGTEYKFLLHIISYNNLQSFCDLETFVLLEVKMDKNNRRQLRGYIFIVTICIFFILCTLLVYIYAYCIKMKNKKKLDNWRLRHLDQGLMIEWYDVAQLLNQSKNTNAYDIMKNYLKNAEKTTQVTTRLLE
ncbi:unnamed protein product, partial [Didymodactylos carnosus]